ncbi:MAG TPA: phospholipase D-like domain-containing protein [Candidatus Saccharimonadia bacterium]|nr:phospholipase D-like domain-containing protein [Candidatus Saccharimonadia bacterium]
MTNYQKPFETATGAKFRAGNRITLLQNGNEIFPAMLEAIRSAQTSIEFVTYVYWRSRVATQFADALCERARAGVTVRVLIDAVGGAIMSTRMVGQLERAGVRVGWFRPIRMGHLRRFNYRTHRKILLIDGRLGFTGGVGIADEWDGDASGPKHWRETHCRVEGPSCLDLFAGFADEWAESTREVLAPPAHAPEEAGHLSILTTPSAIGPRPTPIERLFAAAIAASTTQLWITTAYFVPGPQFIAALCAAAARGVDVRVLTNGPLSNHKSTLYAGRAHYEVLMHAGVKIYEYQRTVLHVKVMTVDHQWATLGSANFDNRSLVLNEELNISVADPTFVAPLDRQFRRDLKDALLITLESRRHRRWHQRLLETTSQAFGDHL